MKKSRVKRRILAAAASAALAVGIFAVAPLSADAARTNYSITRSPVQTAAEQDVLSAFVNGI